MGVVKRTRVVSQVHALVSELSAHLVDSVQATDDEHLEVQLRGDTEVHVHIQIVVVGDERLSGGATSNGVEHGGLHGDEVPVVEPAADVRVNLGTGDEDVSDVVVHHEIEVSLAEPLLGVLEAIVVIGDLTELENEHALDTVTVAYLVQAGRQKNDFNGRNRKFTGVVAGSLLGLGVGSGRVASDA
jgi:hypothetical protein